MRKYLFGIFGLLCITASLTFSCESKGATFGKSPGVELNQSTVHLDGLFVVTDSFVKFVSYEGTNFYVTEIESLKGFSIKSLGLHPDPGRSMLMTYFIFNKTSDKNPLKNEFGESNSYFYSYRSSYDRPINLCYKNDYRIYDIGKVRTGGFLFNRMT